MSYEAKDELELLILLTLAPECRVTDMGDHVQFTQYKGGLTCMASALPEEPHPQIP